MSGRGDVRQHLEERLQPCPACEERGEARLQQVGVAHWQVRCRCSCLGPPAESLCAAAMRWNVRTLAIQDRLATKSDLA